MKKLIILSLVATSCVYDSLHKVVLFKNKSNTNIIVIPAYGKDTISDDILFYGDKYFIKANSPLEILNNIGRTDSTNLFVFDGDLVYKYIRLNIKNNIVNKTFLKKKILSYKTSESNGTVIYK